MKVTEARNSFEYSKLRYLPHFRKEDVLSCSNRNCNSLPSSTAL